MHQPGQNTPANQSPDNHPKDRKYDELQYGKTYAPSQAPVTDRVKKIFRTDDSSFWTGILLGGVVTFLLTSDTVKRAAVRSFSKVSEEAKKEVKKVKKAVTKEKDATKAEKTDKK